jgi:hypothetical protein
MDVLFIIAVLIMFPMLYAVVMTYLSRISGWTTLAEHYRTNAAPEGKLFYFKSGRIGRINVNNALIIGLCPDGLYVSMFPFFRYAHPPLLIPWGQIRNIRQTTILFLKYVEMQVGDPVITTLTLPLSIFADRPIN